MHLGDVYHKQKHYTSDVGIYFNIIGIEHKIIIIIFLQAMWVYDTDREVMVQREISYVPGLYKIFDEILGKLCGSVV